MTYGHIMIYVEGETEEDFVNDILGPYLLNEYNIAVDVVNHQGSITFARFVRDINRFLGNNAFTAVTMMEDIYGIHRSFNKQIPEDNNNTVGERREYLIDLLSSEFGDKRFIPYFQIHEFESLVFSDKVLLSNYLENHYNTDTIQIRNETRTPEMINFDLPPTKLLFEIEPSYRKRIDGIRILKEFTMETIRDECHFFDLWLTDLINHTNL